jgi:hypothetical protein
MNITLMKKIHFSSQLKNKLNKNQATNAIKLNAEKERKVFDQ